MNWQFGDFKKANFFFKILYCQEGNHKYNKRKEKNCVKKCEG